MEIGQQIQKRRKELELTRADLSRQTSITMAGIRKIEAPGSNPKHSTLEQIGRVLRWRRVWIETNGGSE